MAESFELVGANPPQHQFEQVIGYARATTYVIVTTPGIVASGTVAVAVAWTAARKNAAALWATGANTKLTIKNPGTYRVSAFLDWGTNVTGVRLVWIRVNGVTLIAGDNSPPTAQGSPSSADGLFDMKAGDYFEVIATQNSGGNITPTGFFAAVRVSPL